MCGLSLLLVLFSALRGFSLDTLVFGFPQKQHFQIPIQCRFQWTNSHSVEVPLENSHYIIIKGLLKTGAFWTTSQELDDALVARGEQNTFVVLIVP